MLSFVTRGARDQCAAGIGVLGMMLHMALQHITTPHQGPGSAWKLVVVFKRGSPWEGAPTFVHIVAHKWDIHAGAVDHVI